MRDKCPNCGSMFVVKSRSETRCIVCGSKFYIK